MKVYLLTTLILCLCLLLGCVNSDNNVKSPSSQTPSNTPAQTSDTIDSKEPQIFKLTVNEVQDRITENQKLRFPLKIGNRVEGEVNTSSNRIITSVIDPFGNTTIGSSRRDQPFNSHGVITYYKVSTQQYPWKFAFFAAADGEYVINLYVDIPSSIKPSANIRLTVYEK